MDYKNISYIEARQFLRPSPSESDNYSKDVGSNYEESFPTLQKNGTSCLREKLPLPVNQNPSLKKQVPMNKPAKIHQKVTLYKNVQNCPSS